MKSAPFLLLVLSSLCNAQWERVPDIPDPRIVYSLIAVHDTLFVGTDSIVYVGTEGGTRWSAGSPVAPTPDVIACMMKKGSVLLAGTFQRGVFASTNDGKSWRQFSDGLTGTGAMDISSLQLRGDSLVAGTLGAGVFITHADLSRSWSSWGDSLSAYQGDNVFAMLAVGRIVLAGAGANGYLFRYGDARPWWDPVAINAPRRVGQTVSGMASGGGVVVAGTNGGIYRSTNEGASWEPTAATIPPLTFGILPAYAAPRFFSVATSPVSSSLLTSTDGGQAWSAPVTVPLPNVLAIAIAGDTVYLGGEKGLWRAPLSGVMTGAGRMALASSAFVLSPNYPNPFNPMTTISYALPRATHVTLGVYDILGREVARLVDGREEAGAHDARFDGTGLASGTYFYRLNAGENTAAGRLLLLK